MNQGLIAYYPFNANPNDVSGNGLNGTLVNGASFGPDRYGNPNSALLLNGVNQFVEVLHNGRLGPRSAFSFACYFNTTSSVVQTILGRRNRATNLEPQFQVFINWSQEPGVGYAHDYTNNANCSSNITLYNEYVNTGSPLNMNQWYCVAGTFDGVTQKIYLDGVLMSSENTPTPLIDSCTNTPLTIGYYTNQDRQPFKGRIDDVRFYNRALTPVEIQALCGQAAPANAQASFSAPDTVCVNTQVNFTNNSMGASTFNWSFCAPTANSNPIGNNLGNVNGLFSSPAYMDYVKVNGNYYGFVTNSLPGKLLRLDFGNSLNNTPAITDLGSVNGMITNDIRGIQVVNNNGNWYIVVVERDPNLLLLWRIVKISLGTSITNNSPQGYDWGNIGGLNYPQDLQMINDNGHWLGFTTNYLDNTITRIDFSANLENFPVAVNLGNIGNLNGPRGIQLLKENGNWIGLIANSGSSTITRLNFGNTLSAVPTGFNMGNPNGALQNIKDIQILPDCESKIAYAINGDPANNIVKLNFGSSLLNQPASTTLGNIGNLLDPNSLTRFTMSPGEWISFILNAGNNTLSRINITGCSNANSLFSTIQNPAPVIYSDPGSYRVQLLLNEGLPSETFTCKNIVVLPKIEVSSDPDTSICRGDSIVLHANASGATSVSWSPATGLSATDIWDPVAKPGSTTQYIITVSNGTCTNRDTINLAVKDIPLVQLGNDTSICTADSIMLDAGNQGGDFLWQNGDNGQYFNAMDSGYYSVEVTLNGCSASDTVHFSLKPAPIFSIRPDTSVCNGSSLLLSTQSLDNYNFIWSPSSGLSSATAPSPLASITNSIRYYAIATNNDGCSTKDSIDLTALQVPAVNLGNDMIICPGQSVTLDAGNPGSAYIWNDGITTQTNAIASPGVYSVTVTNNNGCSSIDSISITSKPFPVFGIDQDIPGICETDSVLIRASGGTTYEWFTPNGPMNVSDSFIMAYPNVSIQYFVAISDPACNITDTLSAIISVKPAPQITVTKENDVNCLQPAARLSASGGVDYQWFPSININDAHAVSPVVTPQADTWYHVLVTGANGCKSEDSILVMTHFDGMSNFYIPSAFTPNGDGKNDCFGVSYWGPAQEFELNIYNRWGERVYRSKDPSGCWNGYYKGRLQPNGVFVYYIRVKGSCGTAFKKGTVTLLH